MRRQAQRSATLVFAATLGAAVLAPVSAGATTHAAGAARAPASLAGWGTAREVPGTAALNKGGDANISSVSCASPGNCSAGGEYTNGARHYEAFVVSETNGTWHNAEEVPGTAALNQGRYADVFQVSCASPGNCSAGGQYTDGSSIQQAFVVSETNGTWQNAEEVPATATIGQGAGAGITSVSCASPGNCSAGGFYVDASGHRQAFVVNQTHGTWQNARKIPHTAALNAGGNAEITSVSCATAANCGAGGYYTNASGHKQAFVVSRTSGTWQKSAEVPGTAALNQGGNAEISSVSCASPGNCSAGGYYADVSALPQAFVVSETNGTWQNAEEVPGTTALNTGGNAEVRSVSCASAGNCSAGGYYWVNGLGSKQVFVVSENNGTWQNAEEVPGIAALNTAVFADLYSVSCATAGNCSAGGTYSDNFGKQPFVVSENNGTWQDAEEVPGTAALNTGNAAAVTSVSCASASSCSAGGYYLEGSGHEQAFVVGKT
jgi:hypothetical protein